MNREGNLQAPTRHPLEWRDPAFYDEEALQKEQQRIFDICHGCRRCVSLCGAFPTLFDLVDNSATMEIDGVAKEDYWKVVDQCYLCDICYMTKCPYVPPHPWNVDFPHVMLRAKAVKFKRPIARFQAVRHRLAESLVAIEALDAALRAAADTPIPQTAALAKAVAGKTSRTVGAHCQQVLAGIGFTTDHAFHRFFKRTVVLDGLFGTGDDLARVIGAELMKQRSVPNLIEL